MKMNKLKQNKLALRGWKTGSVQEFLGLTDEESVYIELKIKLCTNLKRLRKEQNITQVELAKMLNSSQSRIAKIETGDSSVSLDLIIRSLLALGTSQNDIARAIIS